MQEQTEPEPDAERARPLGFWSCWSLTVGVMIGSGVFTLPAVLAPYGLLSFGAWAITGAGAVLIALTIARLAQRTTRSGGPYVYARDAFGDLTGFLIAWGYWASYWIAIPAIALAFAGYLPVFIPALADNQIGQTLAALALIWALTFNAIIGVRAFATAQIAMTAMKIAPLLAIIALAAFAGAPSNLPAFNPGNAPILPALAACMLLSMWAFTGLEAGCLPASDVRDPARTIPRAVVIGTITVTLLYLAATAAVMLLVPAERLAQATAPFAEAARGLGPWGPHVIAAGALVATAGSLNGVIFIGGQMPMAVALDGLAHPALARRNAGRTPVAALLVSSVLGSLLLLSTVSRGFVSAFTFLTMMATLTVLAPLLVAAAAELRFSWRFAKGWAAIAALAGLYCFCAILGSGLEVIAWGLVLLLVGIPLYVWGRKRKAAALAE